MGWTGNWDGGDWGWDWKVGLEWGIRVSGMVWTGRVGMGFCKL